MLTVLNCLPAAALASTRPHTRHHTSQQLQHLGHEPHPQHALACARTCTARGGLLPSACCTPRHTPTPWHHAPLPKLPKRARLTCPARGRSEKIRVPPPQGGPCCCVLLRACVLLPSGSGDLQGLLVAGLVAVHRAPHNHSYRERRVGAALLRVLFVRWSEDGHEQIMAVRDFMGFRV